MFIKLIVLILAILSIAATADLEEVTHRVYFDIEIDGRYIPDCIIIDIYCTIKLLYRIVCFT